MGLRINTNISALAALRNLAQNDRAQSKSLERLSTGLRINRGADDPSGLIQSELLGLQITGLKQGVENAQAASNLLSTADFVASQISDILNQIKASVAFASNSGGVSQDQIDAEQETVDQAIAQLDRLISSARFGNRFLLNGASEFKVASGVDAAINDLEIRSVEFADGAASRTFNVRVRATGARGRVTMTSAVTTSGTITILRITGPRGTQDITLGSTTGATVVSDATIATAINSVSDLTGVFASSGGTTSNRLGLFTESFGTEQTVRIEIVKGALTVAGLTADEGGAGGNSLFSSGEVALDKGADARVEIDGRQFSGTGLKFSIATKAITFGFSLDPDLVDSGTITTSSTYGIKISNTGGLSLQIGDGSPATLIKTSLADLTAAALGEQETNDQITRAKGNSSPSGRVKKGGFLSSLRTGESNSLSNNAENAGVIVDAAIRKVARVRGYLGSLVANAIEPSIQATNVQIENISASRSSILDLNFAEETTNFTRSQILFQSSIAVTASANLVPQSVLALLR